MCCFDGGATFCFCQSTAIEQTAHLGEEFRRTGIVGGRGNRRAAGDDIVAIVRRDDLRGNGSAEFIKSFEPGWRDARHRRTNRQ